MKNFVSAMLFICAGLAHAADDLIPEIIVTADLRGDSTMQTPASVTVVTEEVIHQRQAQHFGDIIHSIPNMNYASGSNRPRFFQIRGIGERSQFINPINPSVGLLIDDVDFSGAGTIATLMDVSQVEVLRGPQGTRYGANALAGLINITTNEPTDERSFSAKVSTAEFNTRTYGFVLNSPLSSRVNGRLVIESHESDDYIENDFLARGDTNKRDELTVRAKLGYRISESWSLRLSAARVDIDNGYDAFSLDNTRHTLSDEPGYDTQDTTYVSLKSEWLKKAYNVEALFNAARSDLGYGYDEDWTYTGIHPSGYKSTDNYLRERNTKSAEIRLVSNEAGRIFNNSTDWVWGLYYFSSEEELLRRYTFAEGDFISDYDFDTIATFLQLDTRLSDTLTLGVGLRLEERKTEYKDSALVAFSPDDNLRGGRVSLEYRNSDTSLIYASIARGYKAGGFNTDGTLEAAFRSFDEEYLVEYEIGLKSLLANQRLQLQLALFHNDRHDQQVKSSLVRQRPDGSTEFIDFLGNAAEGTNQGIEVDLNWAISDNFRLTANAGWLDAEFDDFINEFGEDLSGRDQAHAPGYTFNLALDYERGHWFAGVSVDGKDEYFFSDRHAVQSDSYTLYNLSLGYATENLTFTLWCRNLTDEDYFVRAFGSFGNDPRKDYVTEPYFQYGEPRIAGVTIEFGIGT